MPEDLYDRAYHRIRVLTIAVALAGALGILLKMGIKPAWGFLLGAALSFANFLGISRTAFVVGGSRPGAVAALLIALRYVLLGAALYAIVKLLGFAPVPVVCGLLAAFGAVILEVLYELIFRPANH